MGDRASESVFYSVCVCVCGLLVHPHLSPVLPTYFGGVCGRVRVATVVRGGLAGAAFTPRPHPTTVTADPLACVSVCVSACVSSDLE